MADEEPIVTQSRELLVAYGKKKDQIAVLEAEEVDELLDNVVDADSAEDMQRRKVACLHWAAERGYAPLLDRLLEIGNNAEGVTEAHKGATPLALAVVGCHVTCAKLLIQKDSDVNATFEGQPCLHLALSLASFEPLRDASMQLLALLLEAGATVSAVDTLGATAAHRAAMAGSVEALELLQKNGAELSTADHLLSTPLHCAVLCGGERGEASAKLILEAISAQDALLESVTWGTAAALAARMRQPSILTLITHAFPGAEAPPGARTATGKALLLHSDVCGKHAPDSAWGPESAQRLQVLLSEDRGALQAEEFKDKVEWRHVTDGAEISDVLRVHEYQYVAEMLEHCAGLRVKEDAAAAAAATAAAAGGGGAGGAGAGVHKRLDLDTVITGSSWDAALCAARAVVDGVDAVLEGGADAAFCVVRPAGHHAGPRGASACFMEKESQSASHGFCLLSNAAIGAAHAMAARGRDMGVKRVAIVDFDVHHGNGTEECVRNLQPARLTHKVNTPVGELAVKSWDYKPWVTDKDSDNVLFASTHSFGEVTDSMGAAYASGNVYTGQFYPGTGPLAVEGTDPHKNILNLPLGPKFGTVEFRECVEGTLLPRLHAFKPDLIIVSAGFDAHAQDKMNYGLVALTEDDYAWVTERLRAVAESCCQGRIVSLLEGGYNVTGGHCSALARSCAAHLRSMAAPPPPPYVPNGAQGLKDLQARLAKAKEHREAVESAQGNRSGRKRRRAATVDYAALDAQLKNAKTAE